MPKKRSGSYGNPYPPTATRRGRGNQTYPGLSSAKRREIQGQHTKPPKPTATKTKARRKPIYEDDPRWNPLTMGNRRSGTGVRPRKSSR